VTARSLSRSPRRLELPLNLALNHDLVTEAFNWDIEIACNSCSFMRNVPPSRITSPIPDPDRTATSTYNQRRNGNSLVSVVKKFVVDSKGRKTGVVLSLKRYKKLLEDLHDLAVVAERRSESTISFAEMKRRLKKDGRV